VVVGFDRIRIVPVVDGNLRVVRTIGEELQVAIATTLIPDQPNRNQARLRSDEGEGDVSSGRSPVNGKQNGAVGLSESAHLHLPAVITVHAEFLVAGGQIEVSEDFGGDIVSACGSRQSCAWKAGNRIVRWSAH